MDGWMEYDVQCSSSMVPNVHINLGLGTFVPKQRSKRGVGNSILWRPNPFCPVSWKMGGVEQEHSTLFICA